MARPDFQRPLNLSGRGPRHATIGRSGCVRAPFCARNDIPRAAALPTAAYRLVRPRRIRGTIPQRAAHRTTGMRVPRAGDQAGDEPAARRAGSKRAQRKRPQRTTKRIPRSQGANAGGLPTRCPCRRGAGLGCPSVDLVRCAYGGQQRQSWAGHRGVRHATPKSTAPFWSATRSTPPGGVLEPHSSSADHQRRSGERVFHWRFSQHR